MQYHGKPKDSNTESGKKSKTINQGKKKLIKKKKEQRKKKREKEQSRK